MGRSAATIKARKGSTRPVSQPGGTSNEANSAAAFVDKRTADMPDAAPATPKREPTYAELKAQVAALEKKNGKTTAELEWRVGSKGGVSVYGVGRFPVTLYYEQWCMILDEAGPLRAFLEKERKAGHLKLKGDK